MMNEQSFSITIQCLIATGPKNFLFRSICSGDRQFPGPCFMWMSVSFFLFGILLMSRVIAQTCAECRLCQAVWTRILDPLIPADSSSDHLHDMDSPSERKHPIWRSHPTGSHGNILQILFARLQSEKRTEFFVIYWRTCRARTLPGRQTSLCFQ